MVTTVIGMDMDTLLDLAGEDDCLDRFDNDKFVMQDGQLCITRSKNSRFCSLDAIVDRPDDFSNPETLAMMKENEDDITTTLGVQRTSTEYVEPSRHIGRIVNGCRFTKQHTDSDSYDGV